jgi:hypothetical protein
MSAAVFLSRTTGFVAIGMGVLIDVLGVGANNNIEAGTYALLGMMGFCLAELILIRRGEAK